MSYITQLIIYLNVYTYYTFNLSHYQLNNLIGNLACDLVVQISNYILGTSHNLVCVSYIVLTLSYLRVRLVYVILSHTIVIYN